MTKSLKAQGNPIANSQYELEILSNGIFAEGKLPTFKSMLSRQGEHPLKSNRIEVFQVNIGYMCNQTCKHCHVDAGPDRREIMSREHLERCLDIVGQHNIPTLDITGGAPEMNPHFRWFVKEAYKRGIREIIVRSNLTILLANKKYANLPTFFREHGVRIISSLPYYSAYKTDRQRGKGVFDKSIRALKLLNQQGYGIEGSGLRLDLVYNPSGAFLPGNQESLEKDFKRELMNAFKISFNELFTITNLPISRYLQFLVASGNYESYMEKLVTAFNPAAVRGLMCRNTISVSWDGYLYDCDFNQMLDLKVEKSAGQHIRDYDPDRLTNRPIRVHQHCYGCTAGAGSSCQGTIG